MRNWIYMISGLLNITNLIFDVLVPYNYHLSDDEIKKQIQKKITEKQRECRAVIKIDKSYTG